MDHRSRAGRSPQTRSSDHGDSDDGYLTTERLVIVDTLPRTAAGQVKTFEIRRLLADSEKY
jgi:hypothetical protein